MKTIPVLALLLLAIVIATILHAYKKDTSNEENNISKLTEGLKGMRNAIPPGANLSIKTIGTEPPVYLFCRYILAFPYAPSDKADQLDTVINILQANASDSLLHSIVGGKKVIWSNKDDRFQYYLTCKQ